jgi:hypothetical protein
MAEVGVGVGVGSREHRTPEMAVSAVENSAALWEHSGNDEGIRKMGAAEVVYIWAD